MHGFEESAQGDIDEVDVGHEANKGFVEKSSQDIRDMSVFQRNADAATSTKSMLLNQRKKAKRAQGGCLGTKSRRKT